MAWIKIDHTTPEKPEVMKIAESLSITPEQAFGHLCRVWIWADQQSLDGHAICVTDKTLDRISGYPGFSGAMRQSGWLKGAEGRISFPNFDNHNGETAKKRALANKRQVTHRSRPKRDISVTREEKIREEEKHSAFVLPDWVPQEPWKAWLEVRSKKKIPNTDRALSIAVKTLESLKAEGQDPAAVLDAATMKGWRGLFPLPKAAVAALPPARKLCAYCESPACGRVNQIDHCRAHTMDAMDEKPRKTA